MMRRILNMICLVLLVSGAKSRSPAYKDIESGLRLATYNLPKSTHGDSTLQVVQLDPQVYQPILLTVSGGDAAKGQSAREWAKLSGASVVVNGGMYLQDYRTAVAHLKANGHINQPRLSRDKSMLAFSSRESHVPKLLDAECDNFPAAQKKYDNLLQGIRMLSCKGKNVWSQQKKKWSQVAIAIDKKNQILLLFARSPYTTHDFIEHVRKLDLSIERMMYLEGGPPAQLYINTTPLEKGWLGSYSTGTNESDDNILALPFPNALAFKRRAPP